MWVKRDARRLSAAMVGLALLVAPNAVADDSFVEQLLPPDELRADYNHENHTIELKWSPPASDADSSFTYRVYRNAVLIGETQDTWYEANLVGGLNVFQVTAWLDGNESAPSQPVVAQQQSSGGGGFNPGALFAASGGGLFYGPCSIVDTYLLRDPPFVSVTIHEECTPIIGPSLNLDDDMIDAWWG